MTRAQRVARTAVAAAAAIALASALAGCGLAEDAGPRPIDGDEAPIALTEETSSQEATDGPRATLWFVDVETGLLSDVRYPIDGPTLQDALLRLIAGESEADDATLSSPLATDTNLQSATVRPDGVAVLEILPSTETDTLLGGQGSGQLAAFAQVVFTTLDWNPDVITGVQFVFPGLEGAQTQTDAGAVDGVVDRDDYASLDPRVQLQEDETSLPVPAEGDQSRS